MIFLNVAFTGRKTHTLAHWVETAAIQKFEDALERDDELHISTAEATKQSPVDRSIRDSSGLHRSGRHHSISQSNDDSLTGASRLFERS